MSQQPRRPQSLPDPLGKNPSVAQMLAQPGGFPSDSAYEELLDRLERELGDDVEFPLFTAAELNSGQFETRYLIPGVLAAGQPGGIFGAFKTLKTSLTADLLISLASGTPFLGQFPVAEPCRTLFLSGESGLAALQSIARRIGTARGLPLETLDNFLLSPKLPRLDIGSDVRSLRRLIRDKKPACLAIDPAYLAIRGEDSRNLFAMGSLLRPLAELGDETGCTILVVHHCKRSKQIAGDPATLDDIAWSGFAEFSAQWLLLSRRRRFDPETGHHELWFSTGGRAGHHGLWALDVDEGRPEDPGGRTWQAELIARGMAETEAEVREMWTVQRRRERRTAVTLRRNRDRVLEALAASESGETPRYLRQELGLTCIGVNAVLASLMDEGLIESTQIEKRDRVEDGYRVVAGQTLAGG